ncbi:MAG: helix-turn-helix domain-containing protein [Candidatus Latescibacteria bacterium]|nr:helix-turn-helix domain-containing protein [Candidatus Latescibacterota bacterium]
METDAGKLAPAKQELIRQRAVAAVRNGMTHVKAAKVFGGTRHSVDRWIKAYGTDEAAVLKTRKCGPKGERSRFQGWQAATICNHIRDRHPVQLKLPFVLWTADAVRQLSSLSCETFEDSSTVANVIPIWLGDTFKKNQSFIQRPDAW